MDSLAGTLKRLHDTEERLQKAEEEWTRLSAGARLAFLQGAHEPFAVGPLLASMPPLVYSDRAVQMALAVENQPERVILPERGDLQLAVLYANGQERRTIFTFEIDWDTLRRKRGARDTHRIEAVSGGAAFSFERIAPDIYRFAHGPRVLENKTGKPLFDTVSGLVMAFRARESVGVNSAAVIQSLIQSISAVQSSMTYAADRLEGAMRAIKQPKT